MSPRLLTNKTVRAARISVTVAARLSVFAAFKTGSWPECHTGVCDSVVVRVVPIADQPDRPKGRAIWIGTACVSGKFTVVNLRAIRCSASHGLHQTHCFTVIDLCISAALNR